MGGEPILARPIGALARLWRWCGRNPLAAGLSAAVVLIVALATTSLAISTVLIWRAYSAEFRQRQLADARYLEVKEQRREARRAVDKCYLEVAAIWLDRQPQMSAVQKRFLEEVLQYYRRFAQEEGEDPEERFDRANAYLRVAHILVYSLDKKDQAREPFFQARNLLEQLSLELPDEPKYAFEFARTLMTLALTEQSMEEAERLYLQAIEQLELLVSRHPAEPMYRAYLVGSLTNLALNFTGTQRRQEAEILGRRADHLAEQLALGPSPKPKEIVAIACAADMLGLSLDMAGNWPEAITFRRKSIAAFRRLTPDKAGLPEYEHDLEPYHWNSLGCEYLSLGMALAEVHQPQEAQAAFADAIRILRKLAADFPAAAHYKWVLFNAYREQGTYLWKANPGRAGPSPFQEAIDFGEQTIAASPQAALVFNQLARLLATCPDQRLRNPHRAVELADMAIKLLPTNQALRTTLALASYRSHDFRAAIAAVQNPINSSESEPATDLILQAMAYWQLHEEQQARHFYGKAIEWIEKNQLHGLIPNGLDLRDIQAEAEMLIGIHK
jgi:hypothetical protein